MADGNNFPEEYKLTINLSRKRRGMLVAINDYMGSDRQIRDYTVGPYECSSLVIKNKAISNRLTELGIVKNKSLMAEYPAWAVGSLERPFIAGIWDGDGICSYRPDDKRGRIISVGLCGSHSLIDECAARLYPVIGKMSSYDRGGIVHKRIANIDGVRAFAEYVDYGSFYDPVKIDKLRKGIEDQRNVKGRRSTFSS